jgi:hypothetical protein
MVRTVDLEREDLTKHHPKPAALLAAQFGLKQGVSLAARQIVQVALPTPGLLPSPARVRGSPPCDGGPKLEAR